MKKKIAAIILALVITLSAMPFVPSQTVAKADTALVDSAAMFNDVKAKDWFKNAVDYVVTHGIFSGTAVKTFSPLKDMTRAQFVQVLANIEKVNTTNKNVSTKFSDVPKGQWYTPAVKWASEQGIVGGVGNGKFQPDASVTREQICVMMVQYADYKNITLEPKKNKAVFTDDGKISGWAKEKVYICQRADLVNGKGGGKFDPLATALRCEASQILKVYHGDYILNAVKYVTVPDVTGKKITEAENTLKALGLTITKVYSNSETVPALHVIRQSAPAGYGLKEGENVTLTVSLGPVEDDPPVTPPDEGGDTPKPPQDVVIDEDAVIKTPVTNMHTFVPDSEQGLAASERYASADTKYDFDRTPIINRDRKSNMGVLPSYSIDSTGFVSAGTRLSDLNGKTLMFYTGDNFANWDYRNARGETVNEWKWFTLLRDELGLNVKMTVSSHMQASEKALKDMNAGKQLDIIYSSSVTYPSSLAISRSLGGLVSTSGIDRSPGVCKNTMELLKWGDTYRVVSPIGMVDVLWYNKTLNQQMGLADPHVLWERDKWNWDSFKNYMYSVPDKTPDGKKLTALAHWSANTSYIWPSTTGTSHIYIDSNSKAPTIVNNWSADSTKRAWKFITGVANNINYSAGTEIAPGIELSHSGLYEGTTLMTGTIYTQHYMDTEYSKNVRIDWVPYPMEKAKTLSQKQAELNSKYAGSSFKPTASHDGIAQFSGVGMLLPKKTVKENLVGPALKFMELWATRCTEAHFDNLGVYDYHNFNYKERKEYFNFITQNTVFGLAMGDYTGSEVRDTNFFKCFTGNSAYNVETEASKASQYVSWHIINSLKYGQ